jgi:hypothetical protein
MRAKIDPIGQDWIASVGYCAMVRLTFPLRCMIKKVIALCPGGARLTGSGG